MIRLKLLMYSWINATFENSFEIVLYSINQFRLFRLTVTSG